MEHENFNPNCTCASCEEYRTKWIEAEYEVLGWEKPPILEDWIPNP